MHMWSFENSKLADLIWQVDDALNRQEAICWIERASVTFVCI